MRNESRHAGVSEPSGWVARFAPLAQPGCDALDLACGSGRHSRLLLDAGHRVTAVDIDPSRLPTVAGLKAIEADLEAEPWPLAGRRFGLIVVANYLWRPLFAELIGALAPEGVLIYETFALGNERYGRPRNPEHLLRPGELLDNFAPHLQVVAYEHGKTEGKRTAIIQRICAINGPTTGALEAGGGGGDGDNGDGDGDGGGDGEISAVTS